ncbi:MAG: tetratricopeptide repeat protein [Gammaproteobacteria bacterium]
MVPNILWEKRAGCYLHNIEILSKCRGLKEVQREFNLYATAFGVQNKYALQISKLVNSSNNMQNVISSLIWDMIFCTTPEVAIQRFQSRINSNPNDADTLSNIGYAYMLLWMKDKKVENYNKSEEHYKKAINIDSNHTLAINNLSLLHTKMVEQKTTNK